MIVFNALEQCHLNLSSNRVNLFIEACYKYILSYESRIFDINVVN